MFSGDAVRLTETDVCVDYSYHNYMYHGHHFTDGAQDALNIIN